MIGGSLLTVYDGLFYSNDVDLDGGAIYLNAMSSSSGVWNSTFYGNNAASRGGAFVAYASTFAAVGSILYGDTSPDGAEMKVGSDSTANVSYSDVQGTCAAIPYASCGAGNIAADPVFAAVVSANFGLQSTSPCIDKGTTVVGTATDKDGLDRYDVTTVTDGTGNPTYADMGAYEYHP